MRESVESPNAPPRSAVEALRALSLPDICRVEDIAAHLKISQSAVRRLLRTGDIPGRRVGRRWLVSRLALLRWVEAAR